MFYPSEHEGVNGHGGECQTSQKVELHSSTVETHRVSTVQTCTTPGGSEVRTFEQRLTTDQATVISRESHGSQHGSTA